MTEKDISAKTAHICTVGTSILMNAHRKCEALPQSVAEIVSKIAFSRPGSVEDNEALKRAHLGDKVFDEIYNLLRDKTRIMSAELNALWKYLNEEGIDVVYLFHTDTETG